MPRPLRTTLTALAAGFLSAILPLGVSVSLAVLIYATGQGMADGDRFALAGASADPFGVSLGDWTLRTVPQSSAAR